MTPLRRTSLLLTALGAAVVLAGASGSFLASAAASGFHVQTPPQTISVRWTSDKTDKGKIVVEVIGLPKETLQELQRSAWDQAQWQQLLAVHVEQGVSVANSSQPPMLGAYRVSPAGLRFEPQFPLQPGLSYRAVLLLDRLPGSTSAGGPITSRFTVPAKSTTPTTVVTCVYPTTDIVPENLLKFYVHFSAPMSRGDIYSHIRLHNVAGWEVDLPFLEIDEELWDPEMKRLTLFIDPGRIKRGVQPLEEIGPALEKGKSYILTIDSAWRDAAGNPLKETFRKTFKVGAQDRLPPDPAKWKLQLPKAGTVQPLFVVFPEPMDSALATRVMTVLDAAGKPVAGKTALHGQERRWTFTPSRTWRRGSYRLSVQTTIEDLAGNNIGKPFEVDLFEGVQKRLTTRVVRLPFQVR
jgi:hypothetical protein